MRQRIELDRGVNYGPATASIYQLLAEWERVEWFAPPAPGAAERAIEHLNEHTRLARMHQPARFPEQLRCRVISGGWQDFSGWCAKFQEPAELQWDWKYSALKTLCDQHSRALGWTLKGQVPPQEGPPQAHGLFLRFGEVVVWTFAPKLEQPAPQGEAARAGWYMSYANMDVTHCIEWQLAEGATTLDGSPFMPLLRCYAEGFVPFSVSQEEMVLFGFS